MQTLFIKIMLYIIVVYFILRIDFNVCSDVGVGGNKMASFLLSFAFLPFTTKGTQLNLLTYFSQKIILPLQMLPLTPQSTQYK